MSCYNKIRSTLNRHKNKDLANSPNSVEEMEAAFKRAATLERYGHSLGDPKRLLYRGTVCQPSYGFSVFASGVVLEYIERTQNPQHYHIDGTFGVVPRCGFRQLLVIHLAIQNHVCTFHHLFRPMVMY